MKLRSILPLAAVALALAALPATATIVGSSHDFSADTWNATGEICKPCHTPHNADTTVTGAPLWNHDVTAVATYILYGSDTFDGAATQTQPTHYASKLCLSCHDGTIALNSFGGNEDGAGVPYGGPDVFAPAEVNFGTDLSNDHPIAFDYTDALATTDGELFPPSTTNSGLGGTIQNDLLFADTLQCASCHDVHNTASAGNAHLLNIDNAASGLCLTCHDK